MMSGPERLRAWIKRSKCNDREAAEMLSITPVFLSQILSGIRKPSLTTAVRFQHVAGVSVDSWVLTPVSEPIDEPSAEAEESPTLQDDNGHAR